MVLQQIMPRIEGMKMEKGESAESDRKRRVCVRERRERE